MDEYACIQIEFPNGIFVYVTVATDIDDKEGSYLAESAGTTIDSSIQLQVSQHRGSTHGLDWEIRQENRGY